MANPLHKNAMIGAVGELLVQIRLLEFGIQAAPPLRDSGNDLVTLKGFVMRCVQVKTTACRNFPNKIKRKYHLLALVEMVIGDGDYKLDECRVYLLTRDEFENHISGWNGLDRYRLNKRRVDECFKMNC